MPEAKITGGPSSSQAETIGGLTGAAASTDVSRVATNLTLATHLGNFVAGQVASQFANERLQSDLFVVVPVVSNNFILLSTGQHQFERLDKDSNNFLTIVVII
jgi:hypothetical protein